MGAMSLIEAVREGDASAVKAALKGGADVNELGQGGTVPLIEAAAAGRADLVELLLKAGGEADARRRTRGVRSGGVPVGTSSSASDEPARRSERIVARSDQYAPGGALEAAAHPGAPRRRRHRDAAVQDPQRHPGRGQPSS